MQLYMIFLYSVKNRKDYFFSSKAIVAICKHFQELSISKILHLHTCLLKQSFFIPIFPKTFMFFFYYVFFLLFFLCCSSPVVLVFFFLLIHFIHFLFIPTGVCIIIFLHFSICIIILLSFFLPSIYSRVRRDLCIIIILSLSSVFNFYLRIENLF